MHNKRRFIKSDENPNPEPLVEYGKCRQVDGQYGLLLRKLLVEASPGKSGMEDASHSYTRGYMLEFDLRNGFPLITQRDLTRGSTKEIIENYKSDPELRNIAGPLRQAIGEIIGFINGARTQTQLESFGCTKFWVPWTIGAEAARKAEKRGIEPGDLGPGSYGAAFHDFPTIDGEGFNQYANMIAQIDDRPELKTHIISPYIPQYISRAPGVMQKVLIVPCHGDQHYHIDVEKGEISLTHIQRSADCPVGLPFNFVHYAALLMMVGQVTGYRPTNLTYFISDAHYYDRHIDQIHQMTQREDLCFPMLYIDNTIDNLFDFRVEHFKIEGYNAHPPINMEGTAI